MRLRSLLLLCFSLIALPGLGALGWLAAQSVAEAQRANRAILVTRTFAEVARAQAAFAVQTGNLSAIVTTATADLAPVRQGHTLALQRLEAAETAAVAAGLDPAPLRATTRVLEDILRRATAAAALPPAARDAAIMRDLVAARTDLGNAMSLLGQQAAQVIGRDAPAIAPMLELAQHVTTLREVGGQRALAVTAFIAGATPQPANIVTLQQLTGRAAEAFANMERLVAAIGRPALTQALQVQRQTYLAEAEPRWRRQVEIAASRVGGGGEAFPYTVDENRRFSVPALSKILEMRDAVLDEALATAGGQSSDSLIRAVLVGALTLVTLLVLAGAMALIIRRVIAPMGVLASTVSRIGAGELALEVPGRDRTDELGEMAQAIDHLRHASEAREALEAAQKADQATRAARAARIDTMLRDFEADTAVVLRAVAAAAAELDTTANSMAVTAREGSARAAAVAQSSSEASSSVGSVAAATEELTASIGEVMRQVEVSAATARQATDAARATDTTVRGLSEAASRIGDVVKLIGDIAGQTNLLALNATIEAARAGEAGKGFAVVASEVKALAAQTGKATEEIGAQITAMQAETSRTVEVVRAIAGTIEALSRNTAQVAEAASQQAEATQEIGRAAAAAAMGTEQVSRHAAGVSQDAEQTGTAAGGVRHASNELARQAEALRTRTDGLLTSIRAA